MAGSVEIHSGRCRGGARRVWGRPLSLDQTDAQRAEKFFWRLPPPHLSQGLGSGTDSGA